jgi:hypothetical protein
MTAPTPPRLVIQPISDGYIPGVCNIGPWEIRRRRTIGIVGLAAAALLLAVLVAVHAPVIARVLVLLPTWGGVFSWLQARRRFCGAYAMRGISNFGTTYTTINAVKDDAAHRADIAALMRMTRDSFVIALVVTAVAVLLPLSA